MRPYPPNLLTVPACLPCNKSFQKDDEYTRTMLAMDVRASKNADAQSNLPAVFRSLQRPDARGFAEYLAKQADRSTILGHIFVVMEVGSRRILHVNATSCLHAAFAPNGACSWRTKRFDSSFSAGSGPDFPHGAFSLYSEQTGAAALWLETQNVTVDGTGRYTAVLGATKPGGLAPELFTTEQARWVGVQVQGQEEQPRVLLVSVPYALKSSDAETIGGLPPSAFVLAGPGSASNPGNGGGAHARSAPAAAVVSGSGTPDFVPLWSASSILGNSVLFQSGSGSTANIGINTTTPADTLDVNGNAITRGNQTVNGSTNMVGDTRVDVNGLNIGSYTPGITPARRSPPTGRGRSTRPSAI